MNCSNCQKIIPDDSDFCPDCGVKLGADLATNTDNSKDNELRIVILSALAGVIIGTVVTGSLGVSFKKAKKPEIVFNVSPWSQNNAELFGDITLKKGGAEQLVTGDLLTIEIDPDKTTTVQLNIDNVTQKIRKLNLQLNDMGSQMLKDKDDVGYDSDI